MTKEEAELSILRNVENEVESIMIRVTEFENEKIMAESQYELYKAMVSGNIAKDNQRYESMLKEAEEQIDYLGRQIACLKTELRDKKAEKEILELGRKNTHRNI